ncbi:MAG: thiopurine S-methyltransferase [Myxococcota bacterium]
MDSTFWLSRWSQDQIGFHRADVHPDIVANEARWLGSDAGGVLVPLCGKSVDLAWLSKRIFTIGVELAPKAVQQFHEEQAIVAAQSPSGAFVEWKSSNLSVLQGSVFELDAEHVGPCNRVWDRAAMVALDPDRRARYVKRLRAVMPTGTQVLLKVMEYDTAVMDGPPHSIDDAEVRAAYAGAHIELLSEDGTVPPVFKERGHTLWVERLFLITL